MAAVDREKVCPLLLRVFLVRGRHRPPEAYRHSQTPAQEIQMHTWLDATLEEIAGLIREVDPRASRPSTPLSFALVTYAKDGSPVLTKVGVVGGADGQPGPDAAKTLESLKFQIGDFVDVAIL